MLLAEVQNLVENRYARASIRVKAKQLSRRKDFGASCREDIEQDLWLRLLTQAERFDGDRGSLNTFIDRVVNSAAAALVRGREREMRADGFHAQSLDAVGKHHGPTSQSLGMGLTRDDGARRFGVPSLDGIKSLEQAESLAVALSRMPQNIRQVCSQLMAGATATTLARRMGISRRQMRHLLAEARTRLEEAGLGVT
jgi:RNA polymerase sigma factor (sigma-70 family)